MANQVGPDIVSGTPLPAGQETGAELSSDDDVTAQPGVLTDPGHSHASYHGRPSSWVAVSFIMAGFLVGAFALVFGPTWVVFWIGAGLVVIGGLLAMMTDIFEDWY
jgi:hypothetical protein